MVSKGYKKFKKMKVHRVKMPGKKQLIEKILKADYPSGHLTGYLVDDTLANTLSSESIDRILEMKLQRFTKPKLEKVLKGIKSDSELFKVLYPK